MAVYRLPDTGIAFPDPRDAEPDGLIAVGGDLTPHRLVAAYCTGIFPWYHEDTPPLWWSLDPRCILLPEEFHLPRSLKRVLSRQEFHVTFDTAFADVITACAEPRLTMPKELQGTWIIPEMIEAYSTLHAMGLAHSVEAWHDGELAGGLYGVSLGSAFFGESMFFRRPNASKVAFTHLVQTLIAADFTLIDCQQVTGNLLRFGAKPVPRDEFLARLQRALNDPLRRGSWANGIPSGKAE